MPTVYKLNVRYFRVDVCRTKEDELEESQLRDELKAIDAALKKNKKVHAMLLLKCMVGGVMVWVLTLLC